MRLPRQGSPSLRDCSYTVHAEVEVPAGDGRGEGVLVSYGGRDGGISLCVLDGHVHFVSNFLGKEHTVVTSRSTVRPGPLVVDVAFERTAPNAGHVRLSMDGELQAETTVARTNPIAFSSSEGLEVGTDGVSPVWPRYRLPFPFDGTIHQVVLSTPRPRAGRRRGAGGHAPPVAGRWCSRRDRWTPRPCAASLRAQIRASRRTRGNAPRIPGAIASSSMAEGVAGTLGEIDVGAARSSRSSASRHVARRKRSAAHGACSRTLAERPVRRQVALAPGVSRQKGRVPP